MRGTIIVFLLLAFSVSSFAIENEAAFLKFRKKAVLEKKVPGCNVYNIVLDDEIYKSASPGFSDLRLTDSEGRIVPFALTKAVEKRRDTSSPVFSKMRSIRKDPENNSVEIVLENYSKHNEIAVIEINTRDKNFEKTITVFSGDDSEHWTLNTENARIFDYSAIADVSCFSVEIKPVRAKYFKVLIGKFTETERSTISTRSRTLKNGKLSSDTIKITESDRSIRIDSIGLRYFFMSPRKRTREYPLSVKSIVNKDKETVISLETDLQPLTSFSVLSDSPDFVRNASVDIPGEDNKYYCIGSGKIFSADTPDGRKNQTSLSFRERRSREFRIRIANAGNPPLENIRIKAEGHQYQLTLPASAGQGPFYLCYGGEFEAPSYDVGEVLEMLEQWVPAFFALEKQENNPECRKLSLPVSWHLGKYFFYAGVLLLVAVLCFVLAIYFKKIEASME